jgi:hypothetical protein
MFTNSGSAPDSLYKEKNHMEEYAEISKSEKLIKKESPRQF